MWRGGGADAHAALPSVYHRLDLRIALPKHFQHHLTGLPEELDPAWYSDTDEAFEVLSGCEVFWLRGMPRSRVAKLVRQAPASLRWITTEVAGVEWLPLAELSRRSIRVTNGAGLRAIPISEYVLMAMLAQMKNLPELVRAQDRSRWLGGPPGRGELYGSRMLVLGWGEIGRAIGARARAFNVEVTGVRRHPAGESGVIGDHEWRRRLGEFHWLVLALPLTPATRHVIGAEELRSMRPDARLVNIARGRLVDQAALELAVTEGWIAGAYLDVTDPEPLPRTSPLWKAPGVMISPHSSWASEHGDERAAARFLENLERYLSGRDLISEVDLARGY